jgi:RimJ/RimL family protein N-acetyltransferase
MVRSIEFRPMVAADLRLLHEWIERPHVKRFYGDHGTYEDVVAHYLPAIEGRDPTDHYIVLLEGRPVGMIQTYVVSDYPEHAQLIGTGDSATAGLDILIGEEELTGKGLGTELLHRFVDEIVFARPETTSCVADPAVANVASVRAFEKAGFRAVSEHVDPADGLPHLLVQLERYGAQSAPR